MPNEKHENLNLYFIAIVPPSPVYDEAVNLKLYFQQTYNSRAALNSPPHITLHMPFLWKQPKENALILKLDRFVKNFNPIKVCLDNFSSFPPRVIFINVAETEILNAFQKEIHRFCKKELNLFNATYREEPFHPHLTLAFRDLKKSAYKTAWEEFSKKEFKAEFMADKISLLKHNGKIWKVFRNFNLGSTYSTDNKSELAATEG